MSARIGILSGITAVFLSGCCADQAALQPISTAPIAAVQTEIKRQVGVYMAAASQNKYPTVMINGVRTPVGTQPQEYACGKGDISFDISEIKAELTTMIDTTTDSKLGLVIPATPVTLGPSLEHKTDASNTQTLDYNLWPVPREKQPPDVYAQSAAPGDLQKAPIALAILGARDALLLGALKMDYQAQPPVARKAQPCFTDYDPQKPASDAGNTFKVALSVTPKDNIGGLSIGVSVVSLSTTGESKSTTGNSLTVSFVQTNTAELQYLRDAVDTECKYPKGYPNGYRAPPSKECQGALNKLAAATKPGEGVGVENVTPSAQ